MLRWILWRLLALAAALLALRFAVWLLHGEIRHALRAPAARRVPVAGPKVPFAALSAIALAAVAAGLGLLAARALARRRRVYVRLRVLPYRTDQADADALTRMFAAVHAAVAERWWRRPAGGQPSAAFEVHLSQACASLAVTCLAGRAASVETALRVAYPNAAVAREPLDGPLPPLLLRLHKHASFIRRIATPSHFERDPQPPVEALLRAMASSRASSRVQLALTPAPGAIERLARSLFRGREAPLDERRSLIEEAELRGGLEVQHRWLFFTDIRVLAGSRADCERIAAVLRSRRAENRLVERGRPFRHGGIFERRLRRGEGNPLPGPRELLAPGELAELWQLPSVEFAAVPLARAALPPAPAPPEVWRPGRGSLRDAIGPVSIHLELRRQNVAVPGTVDQGKSSFLVATVAEDLRRDRCAVIVLDPKGDAAEAAVSAVPRGRTCTLLDLADPTCGFNPLRVDAPPDVIADYVVGALRNLFDEADIRASSDRYLRNAVIAVLAHDRRSTLWDAARLLSVGEEGYAYRRTVGAAVRSLPELKEISTFFTTELTAQLADARSATTAKLDAPVNKLARLLNSASIKRVLLNDSLRVDFDRVIAGGEVLIVKGALGSMGAGNTSVLMQLLVGMLDAALARQQDLVPAAQRVAVALKVDEAPLVLNRGFAETIALKRSAGLETVACWQTDSQWTDREIREQLDALFAHRVYFATASARDARASAELAMAQFSDTVRPGIARLSALGHPDVRLRLPRHRAIASWVTPRGRAAAFVAETLPMRVDRARIAEQAAEQTARGARRLADMRQPHWEDAAAGARGAGRAPPDQPGAAMPAGPPPRSGDAPPEQPEAAVPAEAAPPLLPSIPAPSFRELLDLDRARSARAVARAGPPVAIELDATDLEIMGLLSAFERLLSSQIHRRVAPRRAPTTIQRRLKRLADGALIERRQFHRPDGGGVPMCCSLAPAGRAALEARGVAVDASAEGAAAGLRQIRHELHAAGWALAFGALHGRSASLRGRAGSVLAVPRSPAGPGRPLLPAELRLPGGRVPHDFLKTFGRERVEAERFETLRPDATVRLRLSDDERLDVLIERDDRAGQPGWTAKLERYDHFLAGWSAHTARYSSGTRALAVFLCRDRRRAREAARRADEVLRACRAYAGDYPQNWDYRGRTVTFACERDVHEGELLAWRAPALPPEVRASLSGGEPSAAEARAVRVNLPAPVP